MKRNNRDFIKFYNPLQTPEEEGGINKTQAPVFKPAPKNGQVRLEFLTWV